MEERLAAAAVPLELKGTVFNVQRSSFHDGPGIRTTVFLKGCPLRCPWCHNPEGVSASPQVIVNESRCMSCGACADTCRRAGGPLPSGAELGTDTCTACNSCFEACPAMARQRVGREWTVGEVLAEVLRDGLAYEMSGGGVTFSGGEPLSQPEFLLACLDACRRAGVRTAVDTCGVAPRDIAVEVARCSDLVLWDIKHLDAARHLEATGAPLDLVLDSLDAVATTGVPIWLRMPVIAGYNEDDANTAAVARLVSSLPQVERISLLPYHPTGTAKGARMGRRDNGLRFRAPSCERLEQMAVVLAATGIETAVGG